MCPPRHYAIKYEINPWMKVANNIHVLRARRQWNGLYKTLEQLGIQVELITPQRDSPDMVFTANAGVVSGRLFIPSRFRYVERQGEHPAFVKFFKQRGYRIIDAAQNLYFEGEGDLLPHANVLFGGFGYRSQLAAHQRVSAKLKKPLIPLRLINAHFYHLDTCFFSLDDKTVLYYPPAFDAESQRAIRRYVKNPIAVPKGDADRFACNAFRVGHKVVVNVVSAPFKRRLKRLGYDSVETPTSEFVKAGGSVKCLLLVL
jgi:N-dimethylarginine dimethylaminohydrolase